MVHTASSAETITIVLAFCPSSRPGKRSPGFFLINCANRAEVLEPAARCCDAQHCPIPQFKEPRMTAVPNHLKAGSALARQTTRPDIFLTDWARPVARCAARLLGMLTAAVPMLAQAELTNDTIVGPALQSRPAYAGSDSQRSDLVPVLRWFGETSFVRSTTGLLEGGLRCVLTPGLWAGAQLAYEPGRLRAESDFLRTLGPLPDAQRGVSVGGLVEWDQMLGPMPITTLLRLRRHARSSQGLQADLRLDAGIFQEGALGAGIYAQATWADTASMQSRYGLRAPQASLAGLPTFVAHGGWLNTVLGLQAGYELSARWEIIASVETQQLQGDAARSPLTERSRNHQGSLGVVRQF
jgi:outer membrane protein